MSQVQKTTRQKEIVSTFPSRRFGKLLSVNLSPINMKTCSFNCVYCCTGGTMVKKNELSLDETYSWEEVSSELCESFLRLHGEDFAGINVAGTGEPTIYPFFAEFTDLLLNLRAAHFPNLPVGLFSNCSRIGDPVIRAAMSRYDRKICKLDAGDETTFRRINLPVAGLTLDSIVSGLSEMENVELSTGLIEGERGNLASLLGEGYLNAVNRIRPTKIDLYEFDRPSFRGKSLLGDYRCKPESLRSVADYLAGNVNFPTEITVIQKDGSRGKHPLLVDFRPGFRDLTAAS